MQVSQLRRASAGLGEFEVRVQMLSSQGGETAAARLRHSLCRSHASSR